MQIYKLPKKVLVLCEPQVRYPDRIMLIRGNHESRQITQVGSLAVPGELTAHVALHCTPGLSCHLHGTAARSWFWPFCTSGVTSIAGGWVAHLLKLVSSQWLKVVALLPPLPLSAGPVVLWWLLVLAVC